MKRPDDTPRMSAENNDSASPPAPVKYSRYRSVRLQAEASKLPPPQPEQPEQPEQRSDHDSSVTRSMSRYRRSRPFIPTTDWLSPPLPSIPQAGTSLTSHSGTRDTIRRVTAPAATSQRQLRPDVDGEATGRRIQGRETEAERQQRKAGGFRDREGHEQSLQVEQQNVETEAEVEAERLRLTEEETARVIAEQKRKDLERLEAELAAAVPAVARAASPKEKFGFFTRKRTLTKDSPPASATSGSGASVAHTRSNEPPPRGIEQGGGGIVPGTDAPKSAVNAGERRVLIRCKQSSINLPITPETTPVDIIYSAANIMTQSISPSSAILVESYSQLGLERRIRRYEHVRDVMNSWDRDTQNALIVQNSDSPNFDTDLEVSSVRRAAPKGIEVHMYHSQKPGKWTKRFITLMSSGQIFIAKKTGASSADKDVANICHLSDFDIYTATPQQIRKNLNPPKKFCYAIKSQQKTTMFLNTENFVHFFSTDDESMAEQWYSAVQGWRSWYLVRKKGDGKNEKKKGKAGTEFGARVGAGQDSQAGLSNKPRVSVDENPYTIGTFSPLLDIDRFNPSLTDPAHDSDDDGRPRRIPFHLRHSVSLSPLPSREEVKRHPPPVSYRLPPEAEDEFASSGLLGSGYSERQQALKDREAVVSEPFVEGPSLLNAASAQVQRAMSIKSTNAKRTETSAGPSATSGLQPSKSKRDKTKPLLDFTPQFKEPPQWDKTGKGHGVAPPSGVPLIEVATTTFEPGLADFPKTTLFRRDAGPRPATAAIGMGRSSEAAFVKGGLVSLNTGVPSMSR